MLKIQKFERNFRYDCGYWDNGWQVNDVQLVEQNGDIYTFEANHLTDFALLVVSKLGRLNEISV